MNAARRLALTWCKRRLNRLAHTLRAEAVWLEKKVLGDVILHAADQAKTIPGDATPPCQGWFHPGDAQTDRKQSP
jgi:hypothetical protein